MAQQLQSETALVQAEQDQSIPTRVYQSKVLKNGVDPKCRLCKNNKETVDHIILGCSIIVNTEYLQRHDQVAKYIWTLYKTSEIPHSKQWYKHTSESSVERKKCNGAMRLCCLQGQKNRYKSTRHSNQKLQRTNMNHVGCHCTC